MLGKAKKYFVNLPGQVLLEGLIALSLASVIIIAIVTAVTSSVSTSRVSNLKNQANQYAQEAIELARTQRGLTPGFYCLAKGVSQFDSPVQPESCAAPNIDDVFIRSVEVLDDGCVAGVDNVTTTVSWADSTCDAGEFCQSVKLASCVDPSGGLIAASFPTPTTDPNATPTIVGLSWTPTPPPLSSTPTPTNTPTPTPTSAAPAPSFTFYLPNPSSISPPAGSTLSWTSSNATSCTASGGWSGTKAVSGSEIAYPSSTTTYSLNCTGPGGTTATVSRTVTVTQAPTPTPNQNYFITNQSANLRSCQGTVGSGTLCSLIGTLSGAGNVVKRLAGPTQGATYTSGGNQMNTWYQLQTVALGNGWAITPNFDPVVFPTNVVAIPGSATGTLSPCTYTTDACQRRVLIKPNFDIRVTKIACKACGAQKWWMLNSTSAFAVGSSIASGTTFSTVETDWREATLATPVTLLKDSYYIISFGINTATSTFRYKNSVTSAQYVEFLQARNVTDSTTLNPGTYDIRLTVEGL